MRPVCPAPNAFEAEREQAIRLFGPQRKTYFLLDPNEKCAGNRPQARAPPVQSCSGGRAFLRGGGFASKPPRYSNAPQFSPSFSPSLGGADPLHRPLLAIHPPTTERASRLSDCAVRDTHSRLAPCNNLRVHSASRRRWSDDNAFPPASMLPHVRFECRREWPGANPVSLAKRDRRVRCLVDFLAPLRKATAATALPEPKVPFPMNRAAAGLNSATQSSLARLPEEW